ncbi:DUF1080 domain-containing protein [Compostibacter hankyongensis]|uniref:DUF1080 domain-containing protein n=1 Tax=Compostibacter hankyongensis TaxID=1007089 RepID=A0ABP8FJT2_9BACT
MNKLILALLSLTGMLAGCAQQEPHGEWISLFNGKDLDGWTVKIAGYPLNDNFANTFRVEDGLLKVSYDGYDSLLKGRYGHIFYKQKYSAYLIAVDYRFYGSQVKDGPGWAYLNNGIMLHCQSPQTMTVKQDYPISIECQLLGSDSIATRTNANVCTPGTEVVIGDQTAPSHCTNSDSKPSPAHEWTHVEALVLGDSIIKHIVGTDTVLVYKKPRVGGGTVNDYDPAYKKDGTPLKEGYIALQSESMPTEFREVKLYNLEPYMHDPAKLAEVIHQLQHRNDH